MTIDANPNSEQEVSAFTELKSLILSTTGQKFLTDRDSLIRDAISERMQITGASSFERYLAMIANKGAGSSELEHLVDETTIGETSFFRCPENTNALRAYLRSLDCVGDDRSKPIRVWSAGCANGAEAYSVLILAAEMRDRGELHRPVDVIGTDINGRFLDAARLGIYRQWFMRRVSAEKIALWFEPVGNTFALREKYKRGAHFIRHNLLSEITPGLDGGAGFDAVLCCNVMIYFSAETNALLISRFQLALRPGGLLIVGRADPVPNSHQKFRVERMQGVLVYRRSTDDPCPAIEVANEVESRSTPAAFPMPPPLAKKQPRPAPQPDRAQKADYSVTDGLQEILTCIDRGDWDTAGEKCRHLLLHDPTNPSAHYFDALIHWSKGQLHDSNTALRRALYLDPEFALAHCELARRSQLTGDMAAARRQYAVTLDILSNLEDEGSLRADPRITAQELRSAVQHLVATVGGRA